jgi:dihydropteroate synthase
MRADIRAKRDVFFDGIGKTPMTMGVLNLTPDSFSDGGLFSSADAAFARARQLVAEGCAIVDIGAESTRPGAAPVSVSEEADRLSPVLERIVEGVSTPVSIDTSKATVAAMACRLGAAIVNDVWGLQRDPAIADVAAEAEAGVVITHNRPTKDRAVDIVSEMRSFFDRSLAIAERAGIPLARVILDPGLGFAKTSRQNLLAFQEIAGLVADYRLPVLIGASRKRFLGSLTGNGVEGGLAGTIAVNLAAAAAGAALFRVHDVAENVAALSLFARLFPPARTAS